MSIEELYSKTGNYNKDSKKYVINFQEKIDRDITTKSWLQIMKSLDSNNINEVLLASLLENKIDIVVKLSVSSSIIKEYKIYQDLCICNL